MEHDLKVVEEIKKYLINKLQNEFGYCGVAQGDKIIMLNSGEGNIIINIEVEE